MDILKQLFVGFLLLVQFCLVVGPLILFFGGVLWMFGYILSPEFWSR